MDDTNGGPEITVAFQVVILIDSLDRLQVVAQGLPLDRVAVIISRAHDWAQLEMTARRTAEVIAESTSRIAMPGGPVRLPPPPGRS